MLLDLDKFYSSNYKDFVHKEALEQALKYVPEAFLKDVETKAILSITFSVDDVGENPIFVTYLDKDNKEHIVKLRPNITEQLTEVLKRYPTKVEMGEALDELKTTITNEYTIFVNAEVETLNNTINNVNNSLTQSIKDTLDEAKRYTDTKHEEALEKITEGDTETLAASKDYTDTKNQETQVGLKNYTDTKHEEALTKITEGDAETLAASKDYTDAKNQETQVGLKNYTDTKHEEALTKITEGDAETLENSKSYTNAQLENYATKTEAENANKVFGYNTITTEYNRCNDSLSIHYDDDNITYIGYKQKPDDTEKRLYVNEFITNADIEPISNKLSNIWGGHKAPFIYWAPNIDVNTMKLENSENDVKVILNDGDVVYWRKNEYQPSGAQLKVGFGTELPITENSIVIRADSGDKSISGMYFTAEGDTARFIPDSYIKINEAPKWEWMRDNNERAPTKVGLNNDGDDYLYATIKTLNPIYPQHESVPLYLPKSPPATQAEVTALIQEQNATNIENVSVSLQQKTRSNQGIINNSTLTETKDFKILNLDFSFIPSTLPTSVESEFVENIVIDAPEFNGKSFNITFKANERAETSKGIVGESLTIKTCVMPVDETIKNVKVVVKDKIIIRKETE